MKGWFLFSLLLISCGAEPITLKLPKLGGGEVLIGGERRTRPQLLYFWSLTCRSCLQEIPLVRQLHRASLDKVELIAIPLPTDPPAYVANFAKRHNLSFPIAFDFRGEAARLFRVEAIPLWVLLDCGGYVRWRHLGTMVQEELDRRLQSISC